MLVAPLGSAIGLDADVVFAMGLAEELVPGWLLPGPADAGQIVSPTALEAWTTCRTPTL